MTSGRSTMPGDRVAVAHRLADRDDVGHDAVALEAPHVLAGAAEAGLHLVGDEQAAGLVDRVHGAGFRKPFGPAKMPSLEKDRIDDQHGRLDAVALQVGDRRLDVAAEAFCIISSGDGGDCPARARCAHAGRARRSAERGREFGDRAR